MAVYKDKNGTWYVSARYTNWKGEADRKVKRGFQTKREAAEWEKNFFLENAGNLDMTFEAFYQLYKQNTKLCLQEILINTTVSVVSPLASVSLPKNTSILTRQLPCRDFPSKNTATAVVSAEILLCKATPKCIKRSKISLPLFLMN